MKYKQFFLYLTTLIFINICRANEDLSNLYTDKTELDSCDTTVVHFDGYSVNQIEKKIKWNVKNNLGSIKITSDTLDTNASATALYIPNNNYKDGDVAVIEAVIDQKTYTTSVKLRHYGENPLDLNCPAALEASQEDFAIYSNLKPNSYVIWSASDGITIAKDHNSEFSNNCVSETNDQGIAIVRLKAIPGYEKGMLHVYTSDQSFKGLERSINIKTYCNPVYNIPAKVNNNDDFVISLSNLKPNTNVYWTDGDHAKLQLGDQGAKTTVNKNGYTYARFSVDPDAENINGITARYYGYSNQQETKYFDWICPELPVKQQ